jgi:antitoxin HigA-1
LTSDGRKKKVFTAEGAENAEKTISKKNSLRSLRPRRFNMIFRMYNPPHPGEVLRELWLEPLGLSVTAAARALGVTRKTLSELLDGNSGISPEMSLRLSIALNTTPESWLNQQAQYDLWQIRRRRKKLKVTRLAA